MNASLREGGGTERSGVTEGACVNKAMFCFNRELCSLTKSPIPTASFPSYAGSLTRLRRELPPGGSRRNPAHPSRLGFCPSGNRANSRILHFLLLFFLLYGTIEVIPRFTGKTGAKLCPLPIAICFCVNPILTAMTNMRAR